MNLPRPSNSTRKTLETASLYALLTMGSYFVADSAVNYSKQFMLPTGAPPRQIQQNKGPKFKPKSDYAAITTRNPFNSDGVIPPPLRNEGDDSGPLEDDADPVPSTLPLTLVGTIVHGNPKKSVATIQNKSKSLNEQYQAYRVDYEIDGLAKVLSISRKNVIFRNLNNGRKEFIEIKDDAKIKIGLTEKKEVAQEVKQEGSRFILKREDVLKHTSNLPELLQQARAVPNIIPGSGGQVDGFRLLEMEKGSIFEKLGLKRMDVIKGVNGEAVNSPAKAMELYNELKNSGRIDLEIERNGRAETFNYIIE